MSLEELLEVKLANTEFLQITLKDEFKSYCDSKGYSMNKLIKILIEKEINEK